LRRNESLAEFDPQLPVQVNTVHILYNRVHYTHTVLVLYTVPYNHAPCTMLIHRAHTPCSYTMLIHRAQTPCSYTMIIHRSTTPG
jgi:hypothetical protein